MRIGNFVLFEAAPSKQVSKGLPAQATSEIGAAGTTNYAGLLSDIDYNTKLQGENKYPVYDEMRMSDGQVKATLQFIKLPILSATWEVEAASDDTEHIARFVQEALFNQLSDSWQEALRHLLLFLDYGFSVVEKVYSKQITSWTDEEEDKNYEVRFISKLAPRLPPTIKRWHENLKGELENIEQQGYKGGTQYQTMQIPANKALLLTFDREGNNYEGQSLLRPAYKHWAMKKNLEVVSIMAYERFGMGVPIVYHPSGAKSEEIKKAKNAVKSLRMHEKAYLSFPEGYKIDLLYHTGRFPDVLPLIRYHNEMISAGMLQQFTQLGTTEKGSRALGETLRDPFYLALQATADYICSIVNNQLIKELVEYNFGDVPIPKLKCTNLQSENLETVSNSLRQLAEQGLITPNRETEEHLRKRYKLPDLPEEELPEEKPPKSIPPKPEVLPEDKKKELSFAIRMIGMGRNPTPLEDKILDFSLIIGDYDRYPRRIFDTIREVQGDQIRDLVDKLSKAFDNKNFSAISRIQINKKATLANQLKPVVRDTWEAGREQVRQELARQGAKTFAQPTGMTPVQIARWLAAKAEELSEISSETLKQAAIEKSFATMSQMGITVALFKQEIKDFLVGLKGDKELSLASQAVNSLIGGGRIYEAKVHKDEIAKILYSSVMDQNTCGVCAARDEEEVTEDFVFPNSAECAGGDYCRCMGVYVLLGEVE